MVTVRAELPGSAHNFKIDIEGRTLSISGERSTEKRENGAYQLRERTDGKFSQKLRLSDDLDAEAISAEAKHGVLTLRIPKRAEAKPRQIEVKVS
jgi:HSP20 family protein